MIISSPHNEKLKEIRKLRQRRARDIAQRFVAEGEDLLEAADLHGWTPVERLCAAGSGLPGIEVAPELLAGASELGSGTRALAVYEERWAPAPAGPACVYLHAISDPGNVGTILRSAEAFEASCVGVGPNTADPFGPKAVRASMGAIFAIPVARTTFASLPGTTVALGPEGARPLADVIARIEGDVSLLIGAERAGLPPEILDQADHVARIPIASHSLNAAMAATVALYELRRIRPA